MCPIEIQKQSPHLHNLKACLQRLAQYCANEEMYCMKQIKYMKAHKPCQNFKDDKDMLNLFEDKVTDILSVNPAYHLEFATAKQLLHKLSSETLRDKLQTGLEKVKKKYNHMYNQQNY